VACPDPPEHLDALLRVLHTGVRAIVTGKPWYGSTCAGKGRTWVGELDTAAPIPPNVWMLAVAGDPDGVWDRIPAHARLETPEAFQTPKAKVA
jgi:hypothetical protein